MKRKAKEQIAGGFSDIQAAIAALDGAVPQEAQGATQPNTDNTDGQKEKATSVIGKIGQGKNATLSKAERKRALYVFIVRACSLKVSDTLKCNEGKWNSYDIL